MTDWVTDRPPTEADGDAFGQVWMVLNDKTIVTQWCCVLDRPWQPTNRPDPPEPEKPKRREAWVRFDNEGMPYTCSYKGHNTFPEGHDEALCREVLPGDPSDEEVEALRELADVLEGWFRISGYGTFASAEDTCNALKAVRQARGDQ